MDAAANIFGMFPEQLDIGLKIAVRPSIGIPT